MLSRPRRTVLRAFTLLELIVVLVVLALLAALAIPTFSKVTRRADNEGVRTEVLASMRNMVAYAGISELSAVDIASVDAVVSETTGRAGRDVPFTRVSGASTKYGELSASVKDGVLSTAMVTRVGDCVVARVSALGVPSGEIKELDGAACLPDGSKDGEVVSDEELVIPPLGPPATIVTWTCDDTHAYLKWAPLANATGYLIYKQTGEGAFVQALTGTDNTYDDTQVENGIRYSYYLMAFSETEQPWRASDVYTCTPGSPTPEAPPAPEGVFSPDLYGNPDRRVLDVSWRPVLRASSYSVYVNGVLVGVTGSSKWDLRTSADVNRDYTLTIRATNDGGTSASSAPTTVRADQYVPPAPELRASDVTPSRATLSWSSVEARAVRLYKDGALVGSYDARYGTSTTVGGLSPETAYTFSARASNASGESEPGSVVVVTPVPGTTNPNTPGPVGSDPTAPTPGPVAQTSDTYRLKASASYDRVVLNWQGISGATAYDVYSGSVLLGNTTDLTWTHLGLSEATTYSYFLVAKTGVAPLAPSDVVRVTTLKRGPDQVVSVPVTPSGVTVFAADRSGRASWSTVEGASSYRVYLDGVLARASAVPAAELTGLTNGRTYSLRVSAVNAAGESAQSASVTFTPFVFVSDPNAPLSTPDTPDAFKAGGAGTSVVLSWAASARASSYQVYRDGVLWRQSNELTFSVAMPGESHAWSVAAVNASGASAQTARVSVTTAPEAPVLAGSVKDGAATLTWTQRGPAATWTVLRDGSPVATSSTRSATVTGLANGSPVTFTVVANAGTGASQPSNSVMLTPVTTPAAPYGLSASNDAPAVVLAWSASTAPASAPVSSQQVYRDGLLIGSTPAGSSSWRDASPRPDTTHSYRLASVGPGGTSAQSGPASVRTPPATPSGLAPVVAKDGSGTGVSWNAPGGATTYVLERDGVEVYRGPVAAYSDRSADAGAIMSYRVRAIGTGGQSAWSASVTAISVPAAPVLAARALDQKVNLTWSRPSGAVTYRVYRQSAGTGPFVLATTTNDLAWTDPTVFNSVPYAYYVTASNVAGEGVGSSTLSVTPNIAPPSAPSSAAATLSASGAPTVTWGAATGTAITSYNVRSGDDLVAVLGSAARTWTGPALGLGETAVFSVSATNAGGEGPRRTAAAVVRPGPPAVVTGLVTNGYHQEADVSWTKVVSTTAGPVSGYYVYLDGERVSTLTTQSADYFLFSALTNGRTYTVNVSAYGPAGEGPRSAPARVTPTAGWSVRLPAGATTYTGVVDFIGRQAGGGVWTNPIAAGAISGSSWLTDHTDSYGSGGVIDLGQGLRLTPNAFDVYARGGNSAETRLQGSNDATAWDDLTPTRGSGSGTITTSKGYRYFRALNAVHDVDFYGVLRATSSAGRPSAAPVLNRVDAADAALVAYWSPLASSANLPTTGYRVYVDGVLASNGSVPGGATSSARVSASNGSSHLVEVGAVNVLGEGPRSRGIVVRPNAPTAKLTPVTGNAYAGLFDFLGKRAGSGTWVNPVTAGAIKGSAGLVDRLDTTVNSGTLDLGPGNSMRVSAARLWVWGGTGPQSTLRGSVDGVTWVDLVTSNTGDGTVAVAGTAGYRYFQATGRVHEIELYGEYTEG